VYARIVVPLDGSDLAERALPHGEELASVMGLPLHLIRVVDVATTAGFVMTDFMYSDTLITDARQGEEAAADEYLARLNERYANRAIRVTTERRTGSIPRELLAAARDGDLYVMASHGRGGVSRWFLGSITEEITRHARIPVMVVRVDDDMRQHPVAMLHVTALKDRPIDVRHGRPRMPTAHR
jgi:nucleotide-binding universal stress UspA family protein